MTVWPSVVRMWSRNSQHLRQRNPPTPPCCTNEVVMLLAKTQREPCINVYMYIYIYIYIYVVLRCKPRVWRSYKRFLHHLSCFEGMGGVEGADSQRAPGRYLPLSYKLFFYYLTTHVFPERCHVLQGYLAHKKPCPTRTLQHDFA